MIYFCSVFDSLLASNPLHLFIFLQQEDRGSTRGCKLHNVFKVSAHGLLRARNLEQIWTRVSTSIR
jgi:hypothetical protein